jgi:hypothetical protein
MVTWCTSFLCYLYSDDGTFYFDEKHVDATEYKGPIITSASVVRGVTSFAAVVSGKLNVSIFLPLALVTCSLNLCVSTFLM